VRTDSLYENPFLAFVHAKHELALAKGSVLAQGREIQLEVIAEAFAGMAGEAR
jgi:hypothetical protein